MQRLIRLVLLTVGLSLIITPSVSRASRGGFHALTGTDTKVAFRASTMSVKSTTHAVAWLRRQPPVDRVALGLDDRTIQIWFRDGATVAIAPRIAAQLRPAVPQLVARIRQAGSTSGRAAVLEPFADDLSLGPAAGQEVADRLTAAGFNVDIFRNAGVTVPVMQKLADYSVVYMLTHSGVLDNGHAFILLGETDQHPYDALMNECSNEMPPVCSVMQGIGAGETKLSVAITDYDVQKHFGTFPNSSIVFLNGCEIMSAPAFVSAWHKKNVASVVGWDGKVDSAITELTASLFFKAMAQGETVQQSVKDVTDQGFGTSLWDNTVANLRQDGYGEDTLSQALAGRAPPTATPLPTAAVSPTPLPPATAVPTRTSKTCPKNSKKKGSRCVCKKGYTMKKGKCVKKK